MGQKISSEALKTFLQGKPTPLEVLNQKPDKQQLEIIRNNGQIIVKGDFELVDDLIFHEGEIYYKEIIFDGGNYKNIIFRGGTFKKLFFRRGNFDGYVSMRGGSIDSLVLLGGNFKHWLGTLDGIKNIEVGERMLAEEPLKIKRFELEGGSYHHGLWISGGKIDRFEIKSISSIILHCKSNDDEFYDEDTDAYRKMYDSIPIIKDLIISRYSNNSSYYHFSELDLENLSFVNFTNLGNITISDVKLSKNLTFENSDLGKTTFINCDFSEQEMIFDSSKINEIGLAGTNLPKPANIKVSGRSEAHQKKDALGQLKKVYQNLGDAVTARDYQSEELNTHLETSNPPLGERITLFFNKHSNNHGQRMGQALLLLLGSTLLFYILYCRSLGFVFDLTTGSFDVFWKNASYYFEFLSPFRKSNFIPEALLGAENVKEVPNMAIVIDSLSKIVNAYLLYQFIAAFRKFGKSS